LAAQWIFSTSEAKITGKTLKKRLHNHPASRKMLLRAQMCC
jgi:hypothetical protein